VVAVIASGAGNFRSVLSVFEAIGYKLLVMNGTPRPQGGLS
jgi:imidazoleglycerol phosphate synthase glutamine amidotransferase subunit HisH